MAVLALHSGSTGLSALNTALDVTANNLANLGTTAFKSSRVNFQDLMYQEKKQPGVENANGDERPTGLYVGLGVEVSGTQLDFTQGPIESTDRPLDIAITGKGFFQVEIADDIGDGLGYTRAGNFTRNSDGEMVLATDPGRRLVPNIVIPEDATTVAILSDGTVEVSLPGQTETENIGQIELAMFINPAGLQQLGGNIYVPTDASGDAQIDEPLLDGRGGLNQGMLEASNVDPVTELVKLIKVQRAFEFITELTGPT